MYVTTCAIIMIMITYFEYFVNLFRINQSFNSLALLSVIN